MDVLRISVLMVVVALCVQCSQTQGTSGCVYSYQEQPAQPLTHLNCNPYPNNELILNCEVQGPDPNAFSVVWFREQLNTGQPQRLSNTDKYEFQVIRSGRIQRRQLRVKPLNDSDTGWYYCRVELSNGTLLTSSNRLFLAIQSVYAGALDVTNCPDRAQTARVPSCANITDGTSTVSTTAPTTGSYRGTDLPSSSPTADTSHPSLPTTVTLAPTPTVTPVSTSESNILQVALYAVISVIVVFCAVIVTLAVTIVILYRRKRGHANFKKTADQDQGTNPYSGGFSPDVARSPTDVALKMTPTASTSVQGSDTTQDHVYSRLAHSTTNPPPPSLPANHPKNQYSKLERQHHSETPPPRPPKPPALRTFSNPTVTTTAEVSSQHLSRVYADPEIQNHTEWQHNVVPSTNIYHTMEDSRKTVPSHFYHELEAEENSNTNEEYSYAQTGRLLTKAQPGQEENEESHTPKSLFDDPDYSSVELPQAKDVQMVDPRYVGNYERDPMYIPPTVKVPASELDPKYRGDYERDPRYIPKPPPRRNSCESRPPRPPQRRQSLEGDALTRYMGDYEQDPNYIPPPLRNGNMRKGLDKLDQKYHGDYERDPTYVMQKMRNASQKGKVTSAEYSYPYPPTDAVSFEDLVPPHIPHEYKALEEVLLDPKQEYARLNSEPPENIPP